MRLASRCNNIINEHLLPFGWPAWTGAWKHKGRGAEANGFWGDITGHVIGLALVDRSAVSLDDHFSESARPNIMIIL